MYEAQPRSGYTLITAGERSVTRGKQATITAGRAVMVQKEKTYFRPEQKKQNYESNRLQDIRDGSTARPLRSP